MTSADVASERVTAPEPGQATRETSALEWRFRLIASCLVLVALAFVQEPGKLVADTKLDLAVAPGSFLERALFMWDPEGAFGQLQNQGYGYLFPMGPFFWLADLVNVPPWAAQRAWAALVLVVAFVGLVKLAEALGIGTPLTRIIAGFAFALSPRLVTTIGPISIEAWPSAVAPWVLIPLVYGTRRGSPVRAAALSAFAISCVGGVNAAAAAAVLPLPVLWLLSQRGPRQRRIMLWWPVFTLMGTLWWLVPLFLLGQYSPPFLDFIESARVTTFPTTVFDALRGTSHWVPYLESDWAAGRSLLSEPFLIVDVTVVLALGLIGLARTDMPHRAFLVGGLLVGLVLVTAGHLGALQGWWAEEVNGLLDAALAPLRNVHKYDVILRLPVTLGLAHLLMVIASDVRRRAGRAKEQNRLLGMGVLVIAITAVVGAATPMVTGQFNRDGEFSGIPGYWFQATDWLGARDSATYALLVPGSSFGSYVWGHPGDEPIQPLAESPWAVRNAIPLAPPGNIRMLDAIESRLNTGEGSSGLASYMARAGVEYLVVRNDLARSDDVPEPVLVHQALNESPGIERVAEFGPLIGGGARLDDGRGRRVVVNQGWQGVYPAVEVFQVSGARRAVASSMPPVVAGGPEDLLQLTDAGLLGDEPTVLAMDARGVTPQRRLILTDGLRLKATAFGRVHDNDSPTLTADEAAAYSDRPAREYALEGQDRWATVARLDGLRSVDASSSMADPSGRRAYPGRSAFAALDGDVSTSWVSDFSEAADGPWLDLRFEAPVNPKKIDIRLGDSAGRESRRVVVATQRGKVRSLPLEVGRSQPVFLPEGETAWMRISLDKSTAGFGTRLDIADLSIPGVQVSRPLVLPETPRSWGTPDEISLSVSDGYARSCVEVRRDVRCAPGRATEGEEGGVLDRVVPLSLPQTYSVRMLAAPRPGDELDQLLLKDQLIDVETSSSTTRDPAGGPIAAVDGDLSTTWVADPEDLRPTLALRWVTEQRIRDIKLALNESAPAVPALSVELQSPDGRRTVRLDKRGRGTFKPLKTDQLTLSFKTWQRGNNLNYDGTASVLPVGVSNLELGGANGLPFSLDEGVRRWRCGSGPSLTVNGARQKSALVASPMQLFRGEEVAARACGRAEQRLVAGENRIVVEASPGIRPEAAILESRPRAAEPVVRPLTFTQASPTEARVRGPVDPATQTVVVRQNQNDGWVAVTEKGRLAPVTVDGWQQGWSLVESAPDTIRLEYLPDRTYRTGLVTGLVTFLALIVLVLTARGGAALPPCVTRRPRPLVVAGLATLAMGLVAGTWGASITALGFVLVRWTPLGRWLAAMPWLVAVPLLGAVTAYALNPWTAPDGWAGSTLAPQLLAAVSLALLVVSLAARSESARGARMNGRSTVQ